MNVESSYSLEPSQRADWCIVYTRFLARELLHEDVVFEFKPDFVPEPPKDVVEHDHSFVQDALLVDITLGD